METVEITHPEIGTTRIFPTARTITAYAERGWDVKAAKAAARAHDKAAKVADDPPASGSDETKDET